MPNKKLISFFIKVKNKKPEKKIGIKIFNAGNTAMGHGVKVNYL